MGTWSGLSAAVRPKAHNSLAHSSSSIDKCLLNDCMNELALPSLYLILFPVVWRWSHLVVVAGRMRPPKMPTC